MFGRVSPCQIGCTCEWTIAAVKQETFHSGAQTAWPLRLTRSSACAKGCLKMVDQPPPPPKTRMIIGHLFMKNRHCKTAKRQRPLR